MSYYWLKYVEQLCVYITLEGDEVSVVQVDVPELLLEDVQGVEEVGQVSGALDVGRRAVSPAEQHTPSWPSSLHAEFHDFVS